MVTELFLVTCQLFALRTCNLVMEALRVTSKHTILYWQLLQRPQMLWVTVACNTNFLTTNSTAPVSSETISKTGIDTTYILPCLFGNKPGFTDHKFKHTKD